MIFNYGRWKFKGEVDKEKLGSLYAGGYQII